jgi:iron complex transport system ATP-binding protein
MEALFVESRVSIRAVEITFNYGSMAALKGVSLAVGAGEMTALIGPNGSGKSTLVKCCSKILSPCQGRVFLNAMEIKRMSFSQIAQWIGYVPQSYSTIFSFKVFETVLMGLGSGMMWKYSKKDLQRTAAVLDVLGLTDIADRNIHELSGGQQQRVTIARALVKKPRFLIMDEPTSGLDFKNQHDVMNTVKDMAHRENIGVLTVAHDINLASATADRIVMMKDGMIHAEGKPEDVITPLNINAVFGVDVKVIRHKERPHILPL